MGRLGRVLRPGRVLPGLGRPGLRPGHRLVPLLPGRGHLLPRGPRLLLGGGNRLPRLGQPRLGLPCGPARLPRISLGLLGAGPELGPGLFARRDLRFQPGSQLGLLPRGVLMGLRHLLGRGLAGLRHLLGCGRLGRLPRPRCVLPGLASPGRPCLRGPRRLLGGDRPGFGLGLPRLGLLGAGLKPGLGLLARLDLRFQPGSQLGLLPRGVLMGLRHLLGRGLAGLRHLLGCGRLGRLPRPRCALPGLAGPGFGLGCRDSASAARDCAPVTASSRSCRAAATCSRAARASCSAAAIASRASPSRASACSARA